MLGFGIPWPWWLPFGEVPELSPQELARRLQDGAVQLLDVRTPAEWRANHIAGAINLPIHRLAASLATLGLARGVPVVAICRSAHRSIPAVRLLQRAGWPDAMQLAGGMNAWWALSLPTVSDAD